MRFIRIVLCTLGLGLASVSALSVAGEVPNGTWTAAQQNIVSVQSYWSATVFKIDEASSCGGQGDYYWSLKMVESVDYMNKALDFKKSLLLAAFAAKKKVMLRCEGGFISDIIVEN